MLGKLLTIRKQTLERLFMVRRRSLSDILLLEKRTLILWVFYAGILLGYYISLTPWPLWSLFKYQTYLAAIMLMASLYFSRKLQRPLFNRTDFKYPTIFIFLFLLCQALCGGKNVFGLVEVMFGTVVYMTLFRLDKDELGRLGDVLTTSMACILCVSIPFYLLHLVGFPLPHHYTAPKQFDYTFVQYFFFLRPAYVSGLQLIPRFQCIFLEPSHLGMSCVALLYSQIGKWNTWRCRILFFAIAISLSLAAYVCVGVMLFSAMWMKGKAVLGKLIFLGVLGGGIIVGAIFYNGGNNILNVLIVQRMTMSDDGGLEGDNRTTGVFQKEFDKYVESDDFMWGKGIDSMDKFGFGNAGYRVFIYKYGFMSFLFLLAFFFVLLRTTSNRRAAVTMVIISIISFIPHAIPVKYYFFIPLYVLLFSKVKPPKKMIEENGSK